MYQKLFLGTRLYLASKGSLLISSTQAENLIDDSFGSAIFISSPQITIYLTSSIFHNCSCTSKEINYGSTVCVKNAHYFDMNYTCFYLNFGYGCPDIIVYGDSTNEVDISSINTSSFFLSSTFSESNSCSNWFRATILTIYSINTSSINAKVRFSGLGFGSMNGINIPKTSFVLVDNGTTANYVVEIHTETSSQVQVLDHFVIVNCAASASILGNRASASYVLQFKDSVLVNISCPYNRWTDTEKLSLSFSTSHIKDAPSTDGHTVSTSTDNWSEEYNWPDFSVCLKRMNWIDCSYEGEKLKINIFMILMALLGGS